MFVRKGCVTWYSGKIRFAPEPGFHGTTLERILRATGSGSLLVHDPGRRAYRRELNGQTLFVEGSRLLALDHGLTFRLEAIHDFRRNRRVDILRVQGKGSLVFSVGGPVLSHDVSADFPLSISSRDLVAWTGDLVAAVLDDQYLEEVMQPDVASPPKIRFEGEGTVLTEPPRPRRRAADMDRPVDQRREAVVGCPTNSRSRRSASSRISSIVPRVDVLAIEPHHRLGSRQPVEQPAPLAEDVLDAVDVRRRRDRLARDGGRGVVAHVLDVGADGLDRQVHVAPAVREAAELGGEIVEGLSERAAGERQALDEQQRRQHAVALRQVKREGVAAALLAARHGLAPVHQLGDVLEADAGLVQRRAPRRGGDPVDLEGGREGLRDTARDAAAAEHVQEQQREDLVGRDEAAGGVQHAEPVRVAVLRDGEVQAAPPRRVGAASVQIRPRSARGARRRRAGRGSCGSPRRAALPPERSSVSSVPAAPCMASARTARREARIAARSTSAPRRSR